MAEHEVTIILNGNEKTLVRKKYTYEELYAIAWPGDPIPTDKTQPITYKLPRQHHDQHLLPGEAPIELKDGMIIDVSPSTRS